MKKLSLSLLFCFLISLSFAKNPEEKTFLVLFNKAELKANKTSAAFIELSLMSLFQTKSYSGNSDAAILVKIDNPNMDKCQLGAYIIRINQTKVTQLDQIAFKIYDLDESKEMYKKLMSSYGEKNQKMNKNPKGDPTL